MRMLLCKVKGAASFSELRGNCSTFKETCVALGLLADDKEWEECLREAATYLMPNQLRELFVYILFHNKPSSPLLLWELAVDGTHNLKDLLSEDFRNFEHSTDLCLYAIDDAIISISNGTASLANYGLPAPSIPRQHVNKALQHELDYNPELEDLKWKQSYELFNTDQKTVLMKSTMLCSKIFQKHTFLMQLVALVKPFFLILYFQNGAQNKKLCWLLHPLELLLYCCLVVKLRTQGLQFL